MTTTNRVGIGGHQSRRAGTTTWLTPPHIIDALGPFDLDPCGHPTWPTAQCAICEPSDGLSEPWHGLVWCNPPYDNAWTWLDRLAEHGSGIALVFARTDSAGFSRAAWGKADALLFLSDRLHFHRPDGTRSKNNPGAPSVLVAYGDTATHRLERSGLAGTLLHRRRGWRAIGGSGTG